MCNFAFRNTDKQTLNIQLMKKKLFYTGRVAFAVLILVVAILGYIFYERTLVAWWLPVVAAAIIVVVTLPLLRNRWRWLVGRDNIMELLCHLYVVGCASYGLLLIANSAFADTSYIQEETVTVVSKERVTRRTGQRSGRHYRTTSRTTQHYYVTVCFTDGTTKELPVTRTKYNHAHKDRSWKIKMKRGLFGFKVVEW